MQTKACPTGEIESVNCLVCLRNRPFVIDLIYPIGLSDRYGAERFISWDKPVYSQFYVTV